jgi:glycosyltransferase involved in cell wall biosynthesis
MKVTFVAPEMPLGGAEKQMHRLAKALRSNGVNASILCLGTNKLEEGTVPIVSLNYSVFGANNIFAKASKRIKAFMILKKYFKHNNSDVVVFFNSIFIPIVLLKIGAKTIFSIREYRPDYFKGIRLFLLRKFDIIMSNNVSSQIVLNHLGTRAYLVNNILVKEDIKPNENIDFVNNKIYILVSNISTHKNIEDAIDAFNILDQYGYKLRIIGKNIQEKYCKKLEDKIKGNNITFVGYLNEKNLESEYLNAEGVVHTSRVEGTPNAVLDAVLNFKPFIVSDISEHEILCDYKNEYTYKIGNYIELAEKVKGIHENVEKRSRVLIDGISYFYMKVSFSYSNTNASSFLKILEN